MGRISQQLRHSEYHVETKNLNKAVSRNKERFPESFRFQLTKMEFDEYEKSLEFKNDTLKNGVENLRFQNGTSSGYGGRRYLPYVFTEQGVSMLSAVLRSDTAVRISIQIMQAFVEMRKLLTANSTLLTRVSNIEQKVSAYDINLIESDIKFEQF